MKNDLSKMVYMDNYETCLKTREGVVELKNIRELKLVFSIHYIANF